MSMQLSGLDFLSPRGSPLSTIWGDDRNNLTGTPFSTERNENSAPQLGPNIDVEEDATSILNETEGAIETGEEAIETAEVVSSSIEGLIDPAQLISAGVQAMGQGISSSEDASMMASARTDMTTAEGHGHGIGYQTVAQNNFNNAANAVNLHQAITSALGIFGPLGSLLGAMITPDSLSAAPQSSFMAQTTSGNSVDAQSSDILSTT